MPEDRLSDYRRKRDPKATPEPFGAGKRGKQLLNTTVNLTVSGNVTVQAWDCAAAGSTAAPQLKLRQLHVGGSPQAP